MNKEKLKHIILVSLVIVSTVIVYNSNLLNRDENFESNSLYANTMQDFLDTLKETGLIANKNLIEDAGKLFGIFVRSTKDEKEYFLFLTSVVIWDYANDEIAVQKALKKFVEIQNADRVEKLYNDLGHYFLLKEKDIKSDHLQNILNTIQEISNYSTS